MTLSRPVLSVLLLLPACRQPRAVGPDETLEYIPTADGEHLLMEPLGEPERLLGRAVSETDQGLIIADARAPGCEVTPQTNPSQFDRKYWQRWGRSAALSASAAGSGGGGASFETGTVVAMEIQNHARIDANPSGDCGARYILAVKVGTGNRRFLRSRSGGLHGQGDASALRIKAGFAGWDEVGETVSWSRPQAYQVVVGNVADAGKIGLSAQMPEIIRNGETYRLTIRADREAWLVVMYREADGTTGVLLPSMTHAASTVPAGEALTLPPMQAGLRDPSVAAHETMVVYGFTERATFEQFKPPAGRLSEAEATQYAKQLPERLQTIPRRRWEKLEIKYQIVPTEENSP